MEKYNTRVRQAISDKYVEYSKTLSMLNKEISLISIRLNEEADTLSFKEYVGLENKRRTLLSQAEELRIQVDILDKAREICLEIADDVFTEGAKK